MSIVHLHLMLNHVPVVGILFVVVLFAAALVRRNDTLARTALLTCVVLALVAVVVYFTGEPAEEAVEHLPGTSEAALERPESLALVATILLGIAGVASATTLVVLRRRLVVPSLVSATGLAASVLLAGVLAATASLGGEIRHSEIRGDETAAGAATSAAADADEERERSGRR